MDLQHTDPAHATSENGGEDKSLYMTNRRTLEFFFLAALIALGGPIAVLMGVSAGEKIAAIAYPYEP